MKDNLSKNKIIFDKVYHGYGQVAVLSNLNLVVNPGEVVVLVGPSGCGKTTILNLLSGHITPNAGNIQRDGIMRTVYQSDGLFPWLTVSENISVGLRSIEDVSMRNKELSDLVELVHL